MPRPFGYFWSIEDDQKSAVVDGTTEVCFTSTISKEKTSNSRSNMMNIRVSQEHLAFFMQFVNAYDSVVVDDA
ncbi:hypothetical protein E3N88_38967 [Mikania micrantha]|uniref:Uncharacterized protein n=1 Tax=Mikania micrantha TaxID=192012 RepID=A0A5N6LVN1_9ASTR|nr:hypothetical protein E3N88_38967 [Mikania micrantha]